MTDREVNNLISEFAQYWGHIPGFTPDMNREREEKYKEAIKAFQTFLSYQRLKMTIVKTDE